MWKKEEKNITAKILQKKKYSSFFMSKESFFFSLVKFANIHIEKKVNMFAYY